MNLVVRLSMIVSLAIAICVGWDATTHAQNAVASSQQAQAVAAPQIRFVAAPQTQLVSVPQTQLVSVPQTQLVSVPQTQLVSVPQTQLVSVPQTQLVSVPQTQLVSVPRMRLVAASPFGKKPLFAHKSFASASSVMTTNSSLVGATVLTTNSSQTAGSGNFLVASALSAIGPVESVSPAEATHLNRFVDASGNSLGGLIKGLLRQFLQLNGGSSDQNSLLNIGKLILNTVLPFLSNTGGFNSDLAISDLQKIIDSLLNEKPTPPSVPTGQVTLAPGTYSVSFTDSKTNATTQGTITIGTSNNPNPLNNGGKQTNNASNPDDRGTPAPKPNF
jgi:hypothetical protein